MPYAFFTVFGQRVSEQSAFRYDKPGLRVLTMTKGILSTPRLNLPQWQGGDRPDYYLGTNLLAWLAPEADGAEETVFVPEPRPGETLEVKNGTLARSALLL